MVTGKRYGEDGERESTISHTFVSSGAKVASRTSNAINLADITIEIEESYFQRVTWTKTMVPSSSPWRLSAGVVDIGYSVRTVVHARG